ncbi:hypothetical protein, partial [Denitromonas sp.]|uniref:hypothetical protein n=1 Tax=Denitromonas sp. TaxID=2734609 RepID=UPI003A8AF461
RLPTAGVDNAATKMVGELLNCMWDYSKDSRRAVFAQGDLTSQSIDDLEKALSILSAFCQPASDDEIDMWITRLQVSTAQAGMESNEKAMQNNVYKNELKKWPADAVRAACSKNWKWLPSLGDIEEEMMKVCGLRVSMKTQIEKIVAYGVQQGKLQHLDFSNLLEQYRPTRKKQEETA